MPFALWTREAVRDLIPMRFGCEIISAVNNQGKMRFRVFKGSFTQLVLIDFLTRVISYHDLKSNVFSSARPRTRGLLVGQTRSHLRATPKIPDMVRAYFQEADVNYAA